LKAVTYSFWTISWLDPAAIEQKPYARRWFPLAFAEGIHQFLQLRRALDFEKDLIVIVGDLYVQVFRARCLLRLTCRG
jgi:hypothetical protein